MDIITNGSSTISLQTIDPDINYALISTLSTVINNVNKYFGLSLFILGLIGGLLNIFIFTSHALSANPCATYLLASSVSNVIVLFAALLGPFSVAINTNVVNTVSIACKLQMYFLFTNLTLSSWFMLLASIDRYLISCESVHLRNLSTKKNSHRLVVITTICSALLFSYQLYCFDINTIDDTTQCYSRNTQCTLASYISLLVAQSLLPIPLMLLFGLLTISNMKKIQQRNTTRTIRRKDRQLITMLFVQILILTATTMFLPLFILYLAATANVQKNLTQLYIESGFVLQLLLALLFVNNSTTFYIYTLTGKIFRMELKRLFQNCVKRIKPTWNGRGHRVDR